jgi:hypothetical protein
VRNELISLWLNTLTVSVAGQKRIVFVCPATMQAKTELALTARRKYPGNIPLLQ